MTHVLHVYSGNRFGGIEVLLVELQKRRLDAPEIASSFVLFFEGRLARQLRESGADVSVLPEVRFSRPWTVWRARTALRRHLRQHPVDAVICHEFWAYALAAPIVRGARLPLLSWHHSPSSGYRLERAVRRVPPAMALTCSRFVADNLHGLVPAERIRVCYAPIEPPPSESANARATVRRRLGAGDGDAVILHVGRLSDYKGQVELLQAAERLGERPFRVWFVGDSQTDAEAGFLESLESFVREHRMEQKVRFLGHSDNVYEQYAAADIYCQPNRKPEPYGFTFIEALYAGLPVVASNSGGSAEILTDERTGEQYGVLVPPGEPAAVADALRALIDDPVARARFRERARQRADALGDPRRAMARFTDLVREAIASAGSPAR